MAWPSQTLHVPPEPIDFRMRAVYPAYRAWRGALDRSGLSPIAHKNRPLCLQPST